MRLHGKPDLWLTKDRSELRIGGFNWLKSVCSNISQSVEKKDSRIILDLSNIDFLNLFEWITIISVVEKILTQNDNIQYVDFDLVGQERSNILSPEEYIKSKRGNINTARVSGADFALSNRAYQLSGFIESISTSSVLRSGTKPVQVTFPLFSLGSSSFQAFYGHTEDRSTILLGLTRISKKDDCVTFLDEAKINEWRLAMESKFLNSPVILSKELWRVIFHELSINVLEHSGQSGFLATRIVLPKENDSEIKWWCKNAFRRPLGSIWPDFLNGFFEICIADAGNGFVESLRPAYLNRIKCQNEDKVETTDILSFAFDEFGTRKTNDECWIAKRHALGRILHIVEKYGGTLVLRSDDIELSYISGEESFIRKKNHLGFEPTCVNKLSSRIPGSQMQIILPLFPEVNENDHRRSIFERYMPKAFEIDKKHVKGHLIPLKETFEVSKPGIGAKDQKNFRLACIKLNEDLLLRHPIAEPLIFAFNEINWSASQFETFLHLLQNLLQNRLILLIELLPSLAEDVKRSEAESQPTLITNEIDTDATEVIFGETYSRVNAVVLSIDQYGKRYIYGLSDNRFEDPLLSLIENPRRISDLILDYGFESGELNRNSFMTILNRSNILFSCDRNGIWYCNWGPEDLEIEQSRVATMHFDALLERTNAWWGNEASVLEQQKIWPDEKMIEQPVSKIKKSRFNLPWQEEWRSSFLESSKFLMRERYCDEISQRLIFRLKTGLKSTGKDLRDVKVLCCVTAPALMLATSISKWWPLSDRPIVVDLSFHVLLGRPINAPTIAGDGGIVIVQDILELGQVSGQLINLLKKQNKEILCVISFIRFKPKIKTKWRLTKIDDWTADNSEIPHHALIEIKSPLKCLPPFPKEEDQNSFWIEPRSLHPISFERLRRDFSGERDAFLARRNEIMPEFDSPFAGCLFASGHYVYGSKHYSVAVDVRTLLKSKVGEKIADWIADVCEGNENRIAPKWEQNDWKNYRGDVSVVLIPLHSQIHYIWPQISNLLAQRGRRQLAIFLDATLFAGTAPSYRVPEQFSKMVRKKVIEGIKAFQGESKLRFNPIRLLIIDDSISTARTAETIFLGITRRVREAFRIEKCDPDSIPVKFRPIEWIRYFAILNQMGHANQTLWKNMRYIGNPQIKFLLDEYAPFMGVPIYSDDDCPYCENRKRLRQLLLRCEDYGFFSARNTIIKYYKDISPVAIDGPGPRTEMPVPIDGGISILGIPAKKRNPTYLESPPKHADTAIWRFYKYMHLGYPVGDILRNIEIAYLAEPYSEFRLKQAIELDRYRWAVIEWCLKNWSKVRAASALEIFFQCLKSEVERDSPLIEKILEGCAKNFEDAFILKFVKICVELLEKCEKERREDDKTIDKKRIQRIKKIQNGLIFFFLNIKEHEEWIKFNGNYGDYEKYYHLLKSAKNRLKGIECSLITGLYDRLMRPKGEANPKWALSNIAETLLRGRDEKNEAAGRHQLLLPALIDSFLFRTPNDETRLMLETRLSIFVAALSDIMPYALKKETKDVLDKCYYIMDWLKELPDDLSQIMKPRELKELSELLNIKGNFIKSFNRVFHTSVEDIKNIIIKTKTENEKTEMLILDWEIEDGIEKYKVLTNVTSLINVLVNYSIDPVKKKEKAIYKSKIEIKRISIAGEGELIYFRVLTNFEELSKTIELTSKYGERGSGECIDLQGFGAKFDEKGWQPPNIMEQGEGYKAAWGFSVLSGYSY